MDQNQWSPIPPPVLNGGLYVGQPFVKDAPWATVPVRPTSAYMTNVNLRSANPPVEALFQMQAGFRPGNNTDTQMPGLVAFTGDKNFGPFDFACIPCMKKVSELDINNKCEEVVIPIM